MVLCFEPGVLEAEICFFSNELLTTKNFFLPSNILLLYSLNFLFDKSNKSNAKKKKFLKNFYFFKNKILHRDLKRANVFLNKVCALKLGDLNVSKVAKIRLVYTQTGTPYYSSPESQNL